MNTPKYSIKRLLGKEWQFNWDSSSPSCVIYDRRSSDREKLKSKLGAFSLLARRPIWKVSPTEYKMEELL